MPEVHGKQHGDGNWNATSPRGTESKLRSTGQRRRIEAGISRRLDEDRAVGYDLAALVDMQAKQHVALYALQVQRHRISKRHVDVQHLWRDVGRRGAPPFVAIGPNAACSLGTRGQGEWHARVEDETRERSPHALRCASQSATSRSLATQRTAERLAISLTHERNLHPFQRDRITESMVYHGVIPSAPSCCPPRRGPQDCSQGAPPQTVLIIECIHIAR